MAASGSYANLAYHTLFLKSDGSLHAMGWNPQGQLGDGTTTNRSSPVQVLSSGVTQIAAGALHSLFLKSDGSLHAMGKNAYEHPGTYCHSHCHYASEERFFRLNPRKKLAWCG